jgi:hypothetical protein
MTTRSDKSLKVRPFDPEPSNIRAKAHVRYDIEAERRRISTESWPIDSKPFAVGLTKWNNPPGSGSLVVKSSNLLRVALCS